MNKCVVTMLLIALAVSPVAVASVVEIEDRAAWEAAVGNFSTLDFVIPPNSTPINNQYSHLGVTISGMTFSHESTLYLNDGWGMRSALDTGAWVHFDEPQHWVAIDFSGTAQMELYSNGQHFYTTDFFQGSGPGHFGGLISTIAFDEIYLFKPTIGNNVFIDDLHFGTFIPAPGALGLLALGALCGPRRQRRRC